VRLKIVKNIIKKSTHNIDIKCITTTTKTKKQKNKKRQLTIPLMYNLKTNFDKFIGITKSSFSDSSF